MSRTVTVTNLRQIESLTFTIPPPGVHVLSGANGAGKTCILTCLLRIGSSNAFQTSFRSSKLSKNLDDYLNATITYKANDRSVAFKYSGERWSPSPKRYGKLDTFFGYPKVFYVAANAERIEPRPEDFNPRKIKDAKQSIRDAATSILDDNRFSNLKVVNVRRGTGAEAFILPESRRLRRRSRAQSYYSERNFSLGEICVLKLLRTLDICPASSLVLIDELELALHPRAQVMLFRHLQILAEEKNLTVIFSTHSSTLIKSSETKNLFFVERSGSKTEVINPCYSTYALGHVALHEEGVPDVVIYVEDEQAQFLVEKIKDRLLDSEFPGINKPTVVVLPVGPFSSVVSFLGRSSALLPSSVSQFGLLDEDVKETIAELRRSHNHRELTKFQNVQEKIKFLPWTPEVGLIDAFAADVKRSERDLRSHFSDQRIHLDLVAWENAGPITSSRRRKLAKEIMRDLVKSIAARCGRDDLLIRQGLIDIFVKNLFSDATQSALIKTFLMPLLRSSN